MHKRIRFIVVRVKMLVLRVLFVGEGAVWFLVLRRRRAFVWADAWIWRATRNTAEVAASLVAGVRSAVKESVFVPKGSSYAKGVVWISR
jgi:hypothetical protein